MNEVKRRLLQFTMECRYRLLTFKMLFKLIVVYYFVIHFGVSNCDEFRNVKSKHVMTFQNINRDIDNSIAYNSFSVKSLAHCSYRCARTLSPSLYFSVNDSTCHCNNGTDTHTEHDTEKPVIVYGYYQYHLEVSKYNQFTTWNFRPYKSDCLDLYNAGFKEDGVYTIQPSGRDAVDTWCDMENGGWTVFQRRQDGSEDFNRGWTDYVLGFGNRTGEYWLGLEHIHGLTIQKSELHIFMEAFGDRTPVNAYTHFTYVSIDGSLNNYRLHFDGFSGTCGKNPFFYDGMAFTTHDKDNDIHTTDNCARKYKGGWWFDKCHRNNLNGFYYSGAHSSVADGVNSEYCWGLYYSMKTAIMKVKRN